MGLWCVVAVRPVKGAKISTTRILGVEPQNMELQPENDQDQYNRSIKCLEMSGRCVSNAKVLDTQNR